MKCLNVFDSVKSQNIIVLLITFLKNYVRGNDFDAWKKVDLINVSNIFQKGIACEIFFCHSCMLYNAMINIINIIIIRFCCLFSSIFFKLNPMQSCRLWNVYLSLFPLDSRVLAWEKRTGAGGRDGKCHQTQDHFLNINFFGIKWLHFFLLIQTKI